VFLTIASIAQAPRAAVFGVDDRQYVSTAPGSPYSPVGQVQVGRASKATGTLISRCDVLTVQHAYGGFVPIFHDPRGERASFFGSVGSAHSITSDGTIIAAGGWRRSNPKVSAYIAAQLPKVFDNVGADWMIIRLDECVGNKLGWATLITRRRGDWAIQRHLMNAGFPTDRNEKLGLSIDPDCAILGSTPRALFHDCATMPGNSGGPIFRLATVDGVRRMQIFGIVSFAFSYRHEAVAVPLTGNMATAGWNVRYDASHPYYFGE